MQGALERSQPSTASESVSEELVPAPAPRPILRADLEKTPLTYVSDYWNQLAEVARENLVAVGPTATPGILIGPRLALTTARPALAVLGERNRLALTREESEDSGGEEDAGQADAAESERDVGAPKEIESSVDDVGR